MKEHFSQPVTKMNISNLVNFCQSQKVFPCVSLITGEVARYPSLVIIPILPAHPAPAALQWSLATVQHSSHSLANPLDTLLTHWAEPQPGEVCLSDVCRSWVALVVEQLTGEKPTDVLTDLRFMAINLKQTTSTSSSTLHIYSFTSYHLSLKPCSTPTSPCQVEDYPWFFFFFFGYFLF